MKFQYYTYIEDTYRSFLNASFFCKYSAKHLENPDIYGIIIIKAG